MVTRNNNLFVYPYNPASASAKALSSALGARRILRENSNFRGNDGRVVINWGSGGLPREVTKCRVLNTASAVNICSNKLAFFNHVDGECSIPDWTDSRETAEEWVAGGSIVFARTVLRGSSGVGIVEVASIEDMVDAPLYTRYVPKVNEYRVHIMGDQPFLVQRKALGQDVDRDNANWHIRNLENGFIFVRNEDKAPEAGVVDEAIKCFKLIEGLTFGSVDIIYNKYRKRSYVLEINTASGLKGSTVEDYVNAFTEYLDV